MREKAQDRCTDKIKETIDQQFDMGKEEPSLAATKAMNGLVKFFGSQDNILPRAIADKIENNRYAFVSTIEIKEREPMIYEEDEKTPDGDIYEIYTTP
mmetsp:Transcript_32109/g.29050  ORF Transcript_32109/g.29050 Transcript_32109/m.29050 type:complete len:98 (-) Transcript_32109:1659-1952(-)|eukprot:CAMPEP_0114581980 /NCGR_PEP_ID=MMETSP0125-20121206/6028_1 /TAXON_ID=485358 ORGANISM="Aristerostoma sp., Strain ATCC 50986" /NCGR_SAMPLE_ID=MMETSP0125 /ASSEMBLY_ACC=CAM_ASM_000245 /LENGTH=97 /DNA_ID=CAMNT_0001774609 /DNA_START=708 /DNA_END=1001 /DNA_ORIENTATION=+